jgi:hypothetical protein
VHRKLAPGALGATSGGGLIAGAIGILGASIVTDGAGFAGLGGRTALAAVAGEEGVGRRVSGAGSLGGGTGAGGALVGEPSVGLIRTGALGGSSLATGA